MNKKVTLIILILVFALLLGGAYILYSQYADRAPTPEPEIPTENRAFASDFTVYDREGNPVHLSDYLGKPVVLNFWASWCGPCRSEMPAFQQAYETYGQQVQLLMVNMTDGARETQEIAEDFLETSGYSFPVLFDTQYDATMTYQVYSLPTTILIDKDGQLVSGQRGAMSHAMLESAIQTLLP